MFESLDLRNFETQKQKTRILENKKPKTKNHETEKPFLFSCKGHSWQLHGTNLLLIACNDF